MQVLVHLFICIETEFCCLWVLVQRLDWLCLHGVGMEGHTAGSCHGDAKERAEREPAQEVTPRGEEEGPLVPEVWDRWEEQPGGPQQGRLRMLVIWHKLYRGTALPSLPLLSVKFSLPPSQR